MRPNQKVAAQGGGDRLPEVRDDEGDTVGTDAAVAGTGPLVHRG
ncbi:hypothetical protein ACQPZ2_22845 [Nocardia pseudovaccinii]